MLQKYVLLLCTFIGIVLPACLAVKRKERYCQIASVDVMIGKNTTRWQLARRVAAFSDFVDHGEQKL